MKLLVDMNLSPSWVGRLAGHGFEAVHWSTIGAATAPDVEILTWANEHHFGVITNDLDFSAILAAGAVDGPSVVQIRSQHMLSEFVTRRRCTANSRHGANRLGQDAGCDAHHRGRIRPKAVRYPAARKRRR